MEGQHLLHLKGDKMDECVTSNLPRMKGVTNRWTRAQMDREAENVGQVCTVREVEPKVVVVVSNTSIMQDVGMPECIEEVLQEWGCT